MTSHPNRFTTTTRHRSISPKRSHTVLPLPRDPSNMPRHLRRATRSRPPPPRIPTFPAASPLPKSPSPPCSTLPEGHRGVAPEVRPAAATARKSAPPTSPTPVACPEFGSWVFANPSPEVTPFSRSYSDTPTLPNTDNESQDTDTPSNTAPPETPNPTNLLQVLETPTYHVTHLTPLTRSDPKAYPPLDEPLPRLPFLPLGRDPQEGPLLGPGSLSPPELEVTSPPVVPTYIYIYT